MVARTSSRWRPRIGSVAAALALTALSGGAAAHGGIPRAFSIVFEPGNPDHTILRSDIWGLFRTVDGGQSWQWICAEAYGGDSYTAYNRRVRIAPGGRIFVASSFDGLWTSDDACDWKEHPTFDGELVADVLVHEQLTDVFVLTSTGRAAGGIDGNVWRSTDNGDTFEKHGTPLPTDLAASSLAVAPSAPATVYVAAAIIDAPDGASDALMRSTDGGATWERNVLPINVPTSMLRIHAVHPTEPGTVFLWVDLPERLNEDKLDELWVTTDGGVTATRLYAGDGDLPGFALSADGLTVTVAGPKDGVRSATLADAVSTGPLAFQKTFDGQVWGLAWQGSTLYAGNNDFTAKGLPRFTLGSSTDQGQTFSEEMNVCQAAFPTCDATSRIELVCRDVFTETGGFDDDYLSGDRCVASPAPPDGGTAPTGGSGGGGDDGGCSSAPGGGGAAGVSAMASLFAALALGARLRRGRRTKQP